VDASPAAEGLQNGQQRSALFRQGILVTPGTMFVEASPHQAIALHGHEAVAQDIRGDPLGAIEQLLVARLAIREVAQDDQRPAVADLVEAGSDRASGSKGR